MASSLFSTSNPTILAIPAWHLLSLLPHTYAIILGQGANPASWDNRNPRAPDLRSRIKAKLSPEEFSKWERAEACSANGFENLPLVGLAVVLGNLAKLPRDGLDGLDTLVGTLVALRAVYNVVYLGNDTQGKAAVRTIIFFSHIGICYRILFKAAKLLL